MCPVVYLLEAAVGVACLTPPPLQLQGVWLRSRAEDARAFVVDSAAGERCRVRVSAVAAPVGSLHSGAASASPHCAPVSCAPSQECGEEPSGLSTDAKRCLQPPQLVSSAVLGAVRIVDMNRGLDSWYCFVTAIDVGFMCAVVVQLGATWCHCKSRFKRRSLASSRLL
jgi:hypothetical protein